jgi:hypothetical protein
MMSARGGRITRRFTARMPLHQRSVGIASAEAHSSHVMETPAPANRPATNGPQSDPVSSAHPGSTAISNALSTITAAPRLGSGSCTARTSATAMGTITAVRTVIDGMPSVRTNPITMKARSTPA